MRPFCVQLFLGTLAAVTLNQNPAPVSARGPAAISGVVRNAASGALLADAVVALRAAGSTQQSARQFTDEKGRFVFPDLDAGDYVLTASKPGFLDDTIGGGSTAPVVQPVIGLKDNQWIQNADMALWPFGGISGTVTGDGGEPVAGVHVRALSVTHVAGRMRLAPGPSATSDDRGRYRIGRLPPGRYVLMAARGVYSSAFSTLPSNFDAAPELAAGAELDGIDLRVAFVDGHTVSGFVQGPRTALELAGGLALVPVELENSGLVFAVATTRIGADGAFMFTRVPDGVYSLVASRQVIFPAPDAPGVPGIGNQRTSSAHAEPRFWGRARIVVQGADVTGATLPLEAAASFAVRIVRDVDPAFPEPPRNPTLWLEPAAAEPTVGRPAAVHVPTGSILFQGLRPTRYVFRSGGGWTIKSVIAGGRDITFTVLDARGPLPSEATVTLTNAAPALAGRVQPDAQLPSAVLLFPVERDRWVDYGPNPDRLAVAMTSLAGDYRIGNVPAGSYYAVALPPAQVVRWGDPKFLARAATLATMVRLEWGRATTQDLKVVDVR